MELAKLRAELAIVKKSGSVLRAGVSISGYHQHQRSGATNKPSTAAHGSKRINNDLIGRLVDLIAWPARRHAVGDVTMTLLEGKRRVAEDVFGWNRKAVELGIHEYQTGMACVNDIRSRGKPKTKDKHPKLLAEIQTFMEPHSESETSLRTTLLYTNMTAKTVHEALMQKGWTEANLPSVRTISNLLNRQDYRLRTVAKSKVQKNRQNRCYLRERHRRERTGRCR